MPLIYRAMQREGVKPRIGLSKAMLGVKVGTDEHDDITPDEQGLVHPGTGGMSVAPTWRDLPAYRIPQRLRRLCPKARGSDKLECWRMGSGLFVDGPLTDRLNVAVDHATHGVVEPIVAMQLQDYVDALSATADQWTIDPETSSIIPPVP
jgi:hypothetical protein